MNGAQTRALFGLALAALEDTLIPIQHINYERSVIPPETTTAVYVVIEVWDHQVNIGTTGTRSGMRAQAIKAIGDYLKILQ